MLPFRVHQLQIGSREYLLLPKMTHGQMHLISARLESMGYSVQLSRSLSASSRAETIHVEPSGYCWGSSSIGDAILPAIPEILAFPKERVTASALRAMYLTGRKSHQRAVVRLTTRLESFSLWSSLRGLGSCGLSPDEHAVTSFLMRRAKGRCGVATDFPAGNSAPRFYGKKRYYHSRLACKQAADTLRVAGPPGTRNSYLPRDGLIELANMDLPSDRDWGELARRFGEWCYFTLD